MEFIQQKKFYNVDEGDDAVATSVPQHVLPQVPSLKESLVNPKDYNDVDMDASESSGSDEREEEIVEDFKDMDGENDEDFIAAGSPKANKKKHEKRVARGSGKQSSSRKRKCEFCGTLETPMWRRGPTGKGTLCNACGVKWSLKFRKRAGKKTKQEKQHKHDDLPREQQRHSTRKKLPARKLGSMDSKEEQSPQDYCCSHSPHSTRKRVRLVDYDDSPVLRKKQDHSMGYDDDSSDADDAASSRLLGRLLNVVEVQLVEMRQIELVRRQISELRSELHSKELIRQRQLEQQKTETLHELAAFRQQMLNGNATATQPELPHKKIDEQALLDFIKTIRDQLGDIRATLGITLNPGLGNKLDHFQSELDNLQAQLDADFSALKVKAASDAISMEQFITAKEASIKSGLASLSKCAMEEFTTMNQILDRMEGSL
jgi:hypothetical protein